MQKECASRQPVVGARALAQGVKRNRTDASEAKTSEAKAPLRGLSCPISREIGDRDPAQARSSRGTRRTLCCRFSGLAKGEISKRNSTGAKGFTLAEVLLTLAIIGVVAALTIPAVVTKVTKDQYVVGLKKAYNTLKAVEREAIQEHGPIENWSWSTGGWGSDPTADFERYFLPRFDVLKNCGATTEEGCFAEELTVLSGNSAGYSVNTAGYYKIITSDGMSWAYGKDDSTYPLWSRGWFYVDVNGLKGPNRWGRDIFTFNVFPSNLGIKPEGSYDVDGVNQVSKNNIDANCNTSFSGSYCTAKVLSEGAMNY